MGLINFILLSWILHRLYAPMWCHGLLWLAAFINIVELMNVEK